MANYSFKEKLLNKKMLQYMFMKTRENNLCEHTYYDESLLIHRFVILFEFNHWTTQGHQNKIHLQIFNFLIKRMLLPRYFINSADKSPKIESILGSFFSDYIFYMNQFNLNPRFTKKTSYAYLSQIELARTYGFDHFKNYFFS